MDISEYLTRNRMTQAQLAAHIGVSQSRVAQFLSGRPVPPDRCLLIERATNKQVRCEQLRPDLDWQRDDAGNVTGYIVPLLDQAATSNGARRDG